MDQFVDFFTSSEICNCIRLQVVVVVWCKSGNVLYLVTGAGASVRARALHRLHSTLPCPGPGLLLLAMLSYLALVTLTPTIPHHHQCVSNINIQYFHTGATTLQYVLSI